MYVNNPNTDKHNQAEETLSDLSHETANEFSYEIDVLSQFKANMAQLEDLQMRLKFVLGEVSSVLKKR